MVIGKGKGSFILAEIHPFRFSGNPGFFINLIKGIVFL